MGMAARGSSPTSDVPYALHGMQFNKRPRIRASIQYVQTHSDPVQGRPCQLQGTARAADSARADAGCGRMHASLTCTNARARGCEGVLPAPHARWRAPVSRCPHELTSTTGGSGAGTIAGASSMTASDGEGDDDCGGGCSAGDGGAPSLAGGFSALLGGGCAPCGAFPGGAAPSSAGDTATNPGGGGCVVGGGCAYSCCGWTAKPGGAPAAPAAWWP